MKLNFFTIIIFTLILLGCNTYVTAPNYFVPTKIKNKPFQVIAATNARYLKNQNTVSVKDYLENDDQIKLSNGHLIIVHSSGKFIELFNDTLLNISVANNHIKNKFRIKPINERPEISMLFNTTYKPFIVHDGVYINQGYLMNFDDIQTTSNDSICIKWKSFREPSPSNFKVTVTNMFDELIFQKSTIDQYYLIDFNNIDFGLEPLILIKVHSEEMDFTTQTIPIRISEYKEYYVPHYCEPKNALEALELAFSMEHYYYMVDDAKDYYQLAAELSVKPIYDQLYKNYLMRRDPENK